MKELIVFYSKTGTTKKVAEKIIDEKQCDFDELRFDEQTKIMNESRDPSLYDHIILMSPVWAFALADPMKQYVRKHKGKIKEYDLIVTCSGLGLRGCVKNCISSIGKPPMQALKIRAKHVQSDHYDLSKILTGNNS